MNLTRKIIASVCFLNLIAFLLTGCDHEAPATVTTPSASLPELFAPPRVAVLESSFGHGRHVGDMRPALKGLGWPFQEYRNTKYDTLLNDLDATDIVIFSTVHNYDGKAAMKKTGSATLRFKPMEVKSWQLPDR